MRRIRAWTDYPIVSLGDKRGEVAPIRAAEVLSYDGDKYCMMRVCGVVEEIKAGYIYSRRGRFGNVPNVMKKHLRLLPRRATR